VILLALVCLPATARVTLGPETETWLIGPIITLEVGVWSLPILLLGIIEYSGFRKIFLVWFVLILLLSNFFLVLIIFDQMKYWRGVEIQMLLNYSPFLVPCVIADLIGLLHVVKRKEFVNLMKRFQIRVLLAASLVGVPLFITVETLFFWLIGT
jgi:hypothetical protein